MKHATLSICILLVFIFIWAFYFYYSNAIIDEFANELQNEVILNVKSENWDEAYDDFIDFKDEWRNYRRLAHLFFNTEDINGIDLSIVRCESSIINVDSSSAYTELSTLIQQLKFLHQNEELSLSNVL